jgi:hypothetical protein
MVDGEFHAFDIGAAALFGGVEVSFSDRIEPLRESLRALAFVF